MTEYQPCSVCYHMVQRDFLRDNTCIDCLNDTTADLRRELEQCRAASSHMATCRALLDVPNDEVLYEAIKELKAALWKAVELIEYERGELDPVYIELSALLRNPKEK